MKRNWLVPVGVGAALLLSACGDSATATTSTVLTLESTAYQTLPPTPSTLPPTTTVNGAAPPPGATTPDVTEYTVKSGDVQFTVANKFGVTLDALNLANADTAGYGAFYVGLKIKIPAGATIPTETTAPPSGATDPTQPTTPAETTTTLAGGGSNCAQGSYTIQPGDLPSTVAKKFDVTVAQLEEANAATKGYKNFIVGVKIIIPAKEGCSG
ncbi:MAG: LysM peptidoglycan-binding domain-containing protein [Ilumatobacteraceae bacterium]